MEQGMGTDERITEPPRCDERCSLYLDLCVCESWMRWERRAERQTRQPAGMVGD